MSPTFKALAALSLYLLCAQTFAQSRQADAALCGRGQGAEAFQACLRLANQGNRGAQFNVGLMYSNGEGTAKDDGQALYWFRKSAEQGLPEAQDMLCGRDNGELGLRSCTRQAQAGNQRAQFNLALMYRNGTGVSKDPALAASWYRKAAEQGFGLAQGALGEMYEQGEGVPKDLSQAMYWYWHATAKSGHSATTSSVSKEDAGVTKAAPDRREPVDLGDSKESLLDSVVLVWPSAREAGSSWGSGFLISKCHVMASHHVVFDRDKDEEMKIGKHVVVGLGQTNSPPWKSEIVYGTVVGFDPKVRSVNERGKIKYSTGRDWVVVKLAKGKDGSYPGERRKPLCLGAIDKAPNIRALSAAKKDLVSIGHPADMYVASGKLHLWKDPNCKIIYADGPTWYTDCQYRGGMSGGPLAAFESDSPDGGGCWKPYAIISSSGVTTGGFVQAGERDPDLLNEVTSLDKNNRKVIDPVIEASPCE